MAGTPAMEVLMGITARSNAAPSNIIYNDPLPRKTRIVNYRNGTDTTSVGSVSRVFHACSRSNNSNGKLVGVGRRQRRQPTAFERKVMDAPVTQLTTVTQSLSRGEVYQVKYEEEPFPIPFSAISLASQGTLSPYTVLGNANATAQAMTQCLNNLGDQKVAIGTALAEATKTYDMIADSAIALFKSYRHARRREWRAAFAAIGLTNRRFYSGKSSAAILLQLKYGWTPLMTDIYNGYQYFMDNEDEPLLIKAKSHATWSTNFTGSNSGIKFEGSVKQLSYCVIHARANIPALRSGNRLGLTNPAIIAWELVPMSFVVDWFVPVGNTLQALTDTAGTTFVSGFNGTSNDATVTCTATRATSSATSRVDESGQSMVRYFSHKRDLGVGFPSPQFYAKQKWFNSNRGATALALFRQSRR